MKKEEENHARHENKKEGKGRKDTGQEKEQLREIRRKGGMKERKQERMIRMEEQKKGKTRW